MGGQATDKLRDLQQLLASDICIVQVLLQAQCLPPAVECQGRCPHAANVEEGNVGQELAGVQPGQRQCPLQRVSIQVQEGKLVQCCRLVRQEAGDVIA